MYSFVIGHPKIFEKDKGITGKEFFISGQNLTFGFVDVPPPEFNKKLNPYKVLVRKIAFSCNYRDKGVLLQINQRALKNYSYAGFGSDFVAEVIAVGSKIKTLKIGDRVIPDNCYPYVSDRRGRGIPSNSSSERYSILDEEQLMKVPEELPDEVAACISVSAQTVYSIIRRASIKAGQSILITAASSNTSLFAMDILKKMKVNLIGLTSSYEKIGDLKLLGYDEVVISPAIDNKPLQQITDKLGGFDLVIDPFYDLYLNQVINHMNFYSRYFFCGLYRQSDSFEKSKLEDLNNLNYGFLYNVLLKNISVIGNCLGDTQDLSDAVKDLSIGKNRFIINQVFNADNYEDFILGTFVEKSKIGKMVFHY